MPVPTAFHFTGHAIERAEERGITKALFIEVVTSARGRTPEGRGERGGFRYEFFKQIAGRDLFIVAELHKSECWFVTGYWAR